MEIFPGRAVFYIALDLDEFITIIVIQNTTILLNIAVYIILLTTFPDTDQIVLIPLQGPYYKRNISAVLGFTNYQSNIYLSITNLLLILALYIIVIIQILYLKVQAVDQIKSDFLDSVSYKIRSPLYSILLSLKLLAEISYNKYQCNLLKIAQYSGISLLEIIIRVLYFSRVSF